MIRKKIQGMNRIIVQIMIQTDKKMIMKMENNLVVAKKKFEVVIWSISKRKMMTMTKKLMTIMMRILTNLILSENSFYLF